MTPEPIAAAALDFTLQVERLYWTLMHSASQTADAGLGGRLLYAGELDAQARVLLVAANIAGAASLAATDDPIAQKQSVRDGVADFLVNSLDEALRILKNEIRKRETTAVCIAAAPQAVEREMRDRGVLADLHRPIQPEPVPTNLVLLSWQVREAPAQWLPKLDTMALEILDQNDDSNIGADRRWLRLAPRYLGRLAQGVRVLRCHPSVANDFASRVRNAVARGEIGVEVEITQGR